MKPSAVLSEILEAKRKRNPRYSLRAFALDTGINLSTLSRVLSNKESLTLRQAERLLKNIKIEPELKRKLVAAFFPNTGEEKPSEPKRRKTAAFRDVDVAFDVDWLDVALLELFSLRKIDHSVTTLAKVLGVSQNRILQGVEKLDRHGFIVLKNERYEKTSRQLLLGATESSRAALRTFHRDLIQRGLGEFAKTRAEDVECRLINSFVVSTNPERVKKAKTMIEEFQAELVEFLTEGEPTQVYALNALFFPLTL